MKRELSLKIALAVVGVLFLATAYPLVTQFRADAAVSMMLSLYVTLGVFLLLAVRNPSANRSLVLFTAWSSFAHAAVMGTQVARHIVDWNEMIGVVVLAIIGIIFIVLTPVRPAAGNPIADSLPTRHAAAK